LAFKYWWCFDKGFKWVLNIAFNWVLSERAKSGGHTDCNIALLFISFFDIFTVGSITFFFLDNLWLGKFIVIWIIFLFFKFRLTWNLNIRNMSDYFLFIIQFFLVYAILTQNSGQYLSIDVNNKSVIITLLLFVGPIELFLRGLLLLVLLDEIDLPGFCL
jgi:hypothetical protein